ncbi:MAG TPA: nitronate monooxygenase [bacterium]|nr:nitronate monooxygenase [bacterium]
MSKNRLVELLGTDYPIIQAGMVWVSGWNLAAAASNSGVLGTLGTGSMTLDEIRFNIGKMFEETDRPFAVNIPMLRPDAAEIGKIAGDMGVGIIISSAGNPAKIVPLLKRDDNILIHVVPSVKGAKKAEKEGVDAIICEGYEAGGHNSPFEITTLALTPQVVDAVDIPVIAAGGIADGRGIAAVMALGADGAQLGTRFIATQECDAHDNYKNLIVDSPDTESCIIGRKLSMLRVLRNRFAARMEEAEKSGAAEDELFKIIGSEFNRNRAAARDGDLEEGAFQAGQSAGMIKDIPTVSELVERLVREYEESRKSLRVI